MSRSRDVSRPRLHKTRRAPSPPADLQKKVVRLYSTTSIKSNNQVETKTKMDVVDLQPAVERLEENIDDLEEALQKTLGSSLEETSRKLPLLDRAKLHVWVTYTLETLLHCMSSQKQQDQPDIFFLSFLLLFFFFLRKC